MPSPWRVFAILLLFSAGFHGYMGWRLLPDLGLPDPGLLWAVAAVVLSAALVPLGMLSRFLFRHAAWGDQLAWVGLWQMGWFSSALVLTFLRDLSLVLAHMLGWVAAAYVQGSAWAVLLLATGLSLWGWRNARRRPQVVEVRVPVAGLPLALQGFRIVQISDIHVGPTIKGDYLQAVVQAVNAEQPDLIAITGDVVDGSVRQLAMHVSPLSALRARHGVFVVTGNHEYYSGADAWIDEFRRLGLHVLMNEHAVLEHDGASLVVAGVTDYSAQRFDPAQRSDPHRALAQAPEDTIRILLAHQPRSAFAAAEAGFHLQLSGHTHGGQFFPWSLFVPLQQPYVAGLQRLQDLWVYTSRGTGYWGPPKRIGAPSEITRLLLVDAG